MISIPDKIRGSPIIELFRSYYYPNSMPPIFENYFDSFDHPYNIRNFNHTTRIEDHDTEMAASSVKVMGAKLWDDLNTSYKNIIYRSNFRKEYKDEVTKL